MIKDIQNTVLRATTLSTKVGIDMIKILICDDDYVFADKLNAQLRGALQKLKQQAQIYTFNCAEEIPKNNLDSCDIAFLDIDFKNKKYNGIDIARKLRSINNNAIIIFVTNFTEYAPEGYEVQAFRYLLKRDLDKKLEPYLVQTLGHVKSHRHMFQMNISGESVSVAIEDIIYIESQLHTVNVYVLKPNKKDIAAYSFYSTISSLEERLNSEGFLRIHKSYLVNMRHIRKYQCKEAELINGILLRVSEKNYSEQKKKYLLWKGRQ